MASTELETMNTELDDLLALAESSAPKEFLDEFHRSEAEREPTPTTTTTTRR